MGQPILHLGRRQAGELSEELLAAAVQLVGRLGLLVAEIQERTRRRELLALEEHRRGRAEQLQGRHGAEAAGRRQLVQPLAAGRVRHLVVVLKIADECRRRDVECRFAAPFALAEVPLALVEPAALQHRDQLLRRAEIVAVVSLATARGGDPRGVVEIVAPEHVEAESAALRAAEQPGVLGLAFADDQHPTIPRRLAHPPRRSTRGCGPARCRRGLACRQSACRRRGTRRSSIRHSPGRTLGPLHTRARRSSGPRPTQSCALSEKNSSENCLMISPPGPRWL